VARNGEDNNESRKAGALGLRLNAGKTKLMIVGDMTDKIIIVEGQIAETVEKFC